MAGWGAVVLAAGAGKRMRSSIPKVMHPICGRAMAHYVLDAMEGLGMERTVVVRAPSVAFEGLLGRSVDYVEQAEPLGTAHALLQARPALEGVVDRVLVLNGDVPLISPQTLRRLMGHHTATGAVATFLSCDAGDASGMGRVLRDGAGRVRGIVEDAQATPEQREMREWNCGIYCFMADWLWPRLAALPRGRGGEFLLTDAFYAAKVAECETVAE